MNTRRGFLSLLGIGAVAAPVMAKAAKEGAGLIGKRQPVSALASSYITDGGHTHSITEEMRVYADYQHAP